MNGFLKLSREVRTERRGWSAHRVREILQSNQIKVEKRQTRLHSLRRYFVSAYFFKYKKLQLNPLSHLPLRVDTGCLRKIGKPLWGMM